MVEHSGGGLKLSWWWGALVVGHLWCRDILVVAGSSCGGAMLWWLDTVAVEHSGGWILLWWWDILVVGHLHGGGKLWWWDAFVVVITLHNSSALTTSIC